MLLKPTRNWRNPIVIVPGVGKVTKADRLELPPVAAQYLLAQRMVIRIADDQEVESVKVLPEPIEKEPILVEAPGIELDLESETQAPPEPEKETSLTEDNDSLVRDVWETEILDFLNGASASEIESVRHIGKRTANEIIDARPLIWEDAQTLLTERQIEALVAHQQ